MICASMAGMGRLMSAYDATYPESVKSWQTRTGIPMSNMVIDLLFVFLLLDL